MKQPPPSASGKEIRVLLVDDEELVREGIHHLVEVPLSESNGEAPIRVVGQAGTPTEALRLVAGAAPDVILLDINLGAADGLELIPELLRAGAARIIILTGIAAAEAHRRAMVLGATGVVLKKQSRQTLISAIRKVHAGEVWLDRTTMRHVLSDMRGESKAKEQSPEADRIASLSKRELEVVALIARGLKNKQIAEELFISQTTVSHHLTSIFAKLGVTDRLELIIYAYRNRLVKILEPGVGGSSDE